VSTLARPVNGASPSLAERLGEIQDRVAQAARHSGREPNDVVLVAAIKATPLERVREAVAAGVADLGENRVQEAEAAQAAIGRTVRWHLIGHLQRNKAGKAVALFDRVHGVDDLEVARALSRRAVAAGRSLPVLVQVNVSGEASKHGVAPERLDALVAEVAALPGLALDGVMSIGAPDDARRGHALTRALRDRAERATGVRLPQLSMGMSDDFEAAIEEGSTMVRIGTALFGARSRG
jgi:PLP dependent protein